MNILVNEQPRVLPAGTRSLSQLAQLLDLPAKGVAIAVNDAVVPRTLWEEASLSEGDKVLIIMPASGG